MLVKTIDWDMLISGLFFPPNVTVHIGTVFVDENEDVVAYSRGKAPKTAVKAPEMVVPGILGGNEAASIAFWLLASVGVSRLRVRVPVCSWP